MKLFRRRLYQNISNDGAHMSVKNKFKLEFPLSASDKEIARKVVIFIRDEKHENPQLLGFSSDVDHFQITCWNMEALRRNPEIPDLSKMENPSLNTKHVIAKSRKEKRVEKTFDA